MSCIDYFAALGRSQGPLDYHKLSSIFMEGEKCEPIEILEDAITDIAVVNSESQVPDDSWTVVSTTVNEDSLEPPFIIFRRKCDSKREDYISEIKLVLPGEVVPPGFELICSPVQGANYSNLLSRGFLAIRRSNPSNMRYLVGDTFIDDICFFNKKNSREQMPDNYHEMAVAGVSQSVRHSAVISLALHSRDGIGLCDLSYKAATVDRYPKQDNGDFALPMDALPLFAFPEGLKLSLTAAGDYPMPVFFTFVFTDQDGRNFFVACLRFYEPVPLEDMESVFNKMYGSEKSFEIPEGKCVYCPKVISVISQRPFYRAMRRYLRQLFSLSFSSLRCPLEYFIASVVNTVPLPLEGGRPLHVILDVALISATSRPMASIEFALPREEFFPFVDLDFAGPLRCLSVDVLLSVFTLMLREAKILFVCQSNAMLTEVMETLRALLFPLDWATCFVPRLPSELLGLLQTPGGFMIGIHVPDNVSSLDRVAADTAAAAESMSLSYAVIDKSNQPSSEQRVDGSPIDTSKSLQKEATLSALAAAAAALPTTERGRSFYSTKLMLKKLHYARSIMPGTYIVDLTANALFQYDGKSYEHVNNLGNNKVMEKLLSTLPFAPRHRLRRTLQKIAIDFSIGPQSASLDEFDSAFDIQQQSFTVENTNNPEKKSSAKSFGDKTNGEATSSGEFPTLLLRDAFMMFMIDLLGNFPRYINPPSENLLHDTYRTFQEEFRIQEYLDHSEKNCRSMTELLLETQMFSALLQKRVEQRGSRGLVFYERALKLARELDLSVGGHGYVAPSNPPPGILELPAPVYALLDAEIQFTALGTVRQKQLLLSSASADDQTSTKNSPHPFDPETDVFAPAITKSQSFHHLNYFNPHGGNSANITSTHFNLKKPVTNAKLDHLLTVVQYLGDAKISENIGSSKTDGRNGALTKDVLIRNVSGGSASNLTCIDHQQLIRTEIQSGSDLHLDNAGYGPLIIPGPSNILFHATTKASPPSSENQITDDKSATETCDGIEVEIDVLALNIDEQHQYSYSDGWPLLQEGILLEAHRAVVPEVLQLRETRIRLLEEISEKVKLLIRPASQRFAFEHTGKLLSPVIMDSSEDVVAVVSTALDIVSLSITMLAARFITSENELKSAMAQQRQPVNDIMQILGLIAHLEHWQLFPQVEESTWRLVLGIAANAGGDFMRKVACVIFECINSAFIVPDSLTYGQFVQAIKATKSQYTIPSTSNGTISKDETKDNNSESIMRQVRMDPYLYLEEMGVTWFVQRGVLAEQARQQQLDLHKNDNSPIGQRKFNLGSPSRPASLDERSTASNLLSSLRWSSRRSPQNNSTSSNSHQHQRFYNNSNTMKSNPNKRKSIASIRYFTSERALVGATTEALNMSMALFSLIPDPRGVLIATTPYNMLGSFLPRLITKTSQSSNVPGDGQEKNNNDILEHQLCADITERLSMIISEAESGSLELRASDVKRRYSSSSSSSNCDSRHLSTSSSGFAQMASEVSPTKMLRKIGDTIRTTSQKSTSQQQSTSFTSKFLSVSSGLFRSNKSSPANVASSTITVNTPENDLNLRHGTTIEQLQKLSETLDFDIADDEDDDEEDEEDEETFADTDDIDITMSSKRSSGRKRRSSTAKGRRSSAKSSASENGSNQNEEIRNGSLIHDNEAASTNLAEKSTEDGPIGQISEPAIGELTLSLNLETIGQNNTGSESIDANPEEEDKEHKKCDDNPDENSTNGDTPVLDPASKLNIAHIQQSILDFLQQDMKRRGTVVGIHSYTSCQCGFTLTDEELMATWSHNCLYDIHVKGNSRSSKARNMKAVHAISCRNCGEAITPQLHIRQYRISMNTSSLQAGASTTGMNNDFETVWVEDTHHLSPMALRYELENALQYWGSAAVDALWLQENNPTLLWGIIWYSTRLNVPSGLLLNTSSLPELKCRKFQKSSYPGSAHRNASLSLSINEILLNAETTESKTRTSILPYEENYDEQEAQRVRKVLTSGVVIGWRECSVKAKIQRWLSQDFALNPSVKDVFPECDDTDLLRLKDEVYPKLDGSPAGFRAAAVGFVQIPGIDRQLRSSGMPRGRAIYLGLLTLCLVSDATALTTQPLISSIPKRLKKEIPFENVFQEAIRCVMSQSDFELLDCTSKELLAACPGKEAIAMRNGFGFLF